MEGPNVAGLSLYATLGSQKGQTLNLYLERWPRLVWVGVGTLLVVGAMLAGRGLAPGHDPLLAQEKAAYAARGDAGLTANMNAAMRALAARHEPGVRRADLWARPLGWSSLDLRRPPSLGLAEADSETAEQLNALRPFARLPIRPMQPFVLASAGEDRARALDCLTQAVYYEAARESEVGQEAVAQVVLNRMRHPAYPKTVCGVVYQGAARTTGCQFTFTCDGSMRYAPQPALWRQARGVAEQALGGFVDKTVGSATHYHAQYVSPYWAPTLVKMVQVGQHIFYRWTGPWGEPPAFTGRYAGGEAYLSPAVLGSLDARTQGGLLAPELQGPVERKITLAVNGEVRTYSVMDPGTLGAVVPQARGMLTLTRRQPTPDEIKRINQSLEAMERSMEPARSAPPPSLAPASSGRASPGV